jgi:pre-mRNA-splicing factor ATP-dependent RNA helicase DHX38/PRP16
MLPVDEYFLKSNPSDYVAAAISQVCSIHLKEQSVDILIFLTGQDDVECFCE